MNVEKLHKMQAAVLKESTSAAFGKQAAASPERQGRTRAPDSAVTMRDYTHLIANIRNYEISELQYPATV